MAKPIPVELRRRIVEAFDRGSIREEVADQFGVSMPSVTRLLALRRRTGSLEPTSPPGRPPVLDEHVGEQMRVWVQGQSDLTLGELQKRLESVGCSVGLTAIFAKLKRMGLRRKKNVARRRARPARRAGQAENLAGGHKPDTCAESGIS